MIKLISANGDIQYDVNEYVIDTPEDLMNMPKDCAMGSIAIVVSTSEVYMKNSAGEWVKL